MTIANDTPAIPNRAGRRVSFHTLGCKLNQAETDTIAALFRQRGWQVVPFRQESELTVINTCTVTSEADAKSRQAIHRAARTSPRGKVAVVGCYAQVKPEEAASFEGVDLVLGTREKWRILELLDQLEGTGPSQPLRQSLGLAQDMAQDRPLVLVGDIDEAETYDEAPFISAATPSGWPPRTRRRPWPFRPRGGRHVEAGREPRRSRHGESGQGPTGRTRALLKVQEGCDYHCSYCIVPAARGRGRSRPLDDCLEEARRLAAEGYCEIVLTGVNIGTWEADDLRFHDLLAAVSRVEGLRRVRISSIEPNLITDEIIRLAAERENIAPHFHVPLQHASDRVLKAMRRRYCIADYRAVLERIVAAIPDAAIGADVMVGFPGETEEDFRQLAGALTELPLTYHHIFRYSERSGTVASRMIPPGSPWLCRGSAGMTAIVDPVVRKERSAVLRGISRQRRREVARRSIGQTRLVHFERSDGNGSWEGLTDNYLRVKVPVPTPLDDPFQPVRLTGYGNSTLLGRLSRPVGAPKGAL